MILLMLIVGNIRSGKTLLLTILIRYVFEKLKITPGLYGSIKANYFTRYSQLINVNELLEFELEDCFLGLDELGTLIDSRTNTQSQRFIDYFITQSGKRGVDIIGTSQLSSMVDLRFRNLVSRTFFAECDEEKFNYKVYEGYAEINNFSIRRERAKMFYADYDTKELIYPIDLFSGQTVDFGKLQKILDDAPTKKAFVQTSKRDYPYISLENLNAVYDYMHNNQLKEAKRVLGVKDK